MRLIENKSYGCSECGAYIVPTVVPGRIPDERPMQIFTHPEGTCSSAGQVFGFPVRIIDTDNLGLSCGSSPF